MAIWLRNARRFAGNGPDSLADARVGASAEIIDATEFGALVALDEGYRALAEERDALLADAREKAARLVAQGKAEAAALVEEARRERDSAAEQGYRAGEERGIADWYERVAQTGDAHAILLERMREKLATVISVATEKIVKVQRREQLFEGALAEVDRIADGATYLNIAVHPDDHGHAQAAFDRLASRWRGLGQAFPLAVLADRRLAPGSCVAESDFGTVDASLDTQLRAMRNAVSRALKSAVRDADREDEAQIGLRDDPEGPHGETDSE